jgi:hypothetical protein
VPNATLNEIKSQGLVEFVYKHLQKSTKVNWKGAENSLLISSNVVFRINNLQPDQLLLLYWLRKVSMQRWNLEYALTFKISRLGKIQKQKWNYGKHVLLCTHEIFCGERCLDKNQRVFWKNTKSIFPNRKEPSYRNVNFSHAVLYQNFLICTSELHCLSHTTTCGQHNKRRWKTRPLTIICMKELLLGVGKAQ